MARVIQNELKRPLADAILFGELQNGGQVDVDVEGEGEGRKLTLKFSQNTPEEKEPELAAPQAPSATS